MKSRRPAPPPGLSLICVTLTVILASIDHFYLFGSRALVAGFGAIVLLHVLIFLFWRTRNKAFLMIYGILNGFILLGFGLANGFWNHACKLFLTYLHNGMPTPLAHLFSHPTVGCFVYEGSGTLAFVTSVFAAYFAYQFVRDSVREKEHEELH